MNMQNCTLCPRNCHADRTRGYGFCRAGEKTEIALVSLHRWEEPCLSGQNGAGTVFFSHCSMQCIFCQNHEISTEGKGLKLSIERLAQIFLEQQQRHAHCLELVTPTHYVPQIIQALTIAKQKGLTIPVVYNCSGYEKTETLEKLRDYVDVFLPDFKYFYSETAQEYSHAPDYPQIAKKSHRQNVRTCRPARIQRRHHAERRDYPPSHPAVALQGKHGNRQIHLGNVS